MLYIGNLTVIKRLFCCFNVLFVYHIILLYFFQVILNTKPITIL